ncbi:Growth factor receptor-bound protein 14-like [Oopsacas minuta]|uniref:Growth factor receptor-bound protein 14-like n=1 Tax=Oopsacas minuta TaxID=111878 RepID=A0AAV7JDQ8_9METZ|nr:Growth factor receptor-bound protein 14-like [Oopsacas minuta]
MKVASKQKIVIKAFNEDMSSKTVVVDDDMQSWYVSQMLIMKNHTTDSPNWGLIEFLPEFSLQRMLEDHETVVDAYQAWPRETQNMFIFKNDEYKYDLFHRPYEYFPAELCLSNEQAKNTKDPRTERARKMLINEYFSEQGRIPELEGHLFIKEGKKPWKRLFVLLRGSGIYYSNRGKSKQSKHLVSFCSLNDHDVYIANNYKKIASAPKNYCFVLKPQARHLTVGWGDMRYFCAPNKRLMFSWMAGIRLVKHGGPQLKENFVSMQNKEYKLAQIEKESEDQFHEGTSPPQTGKLNRVSSMPASATAQISITEPKRQLTYTSSQPHEPKAPVPYNQTSRRISIMSPTETPTPTPAGEMPSITLQHPGAFPLPIPATQLPLQPPGNDSIQITPHKSTLPLPPPVAGIQPPPPLINQRPIAPKPSKKPLFIPRSEQESKYNPNSPMMPRKNTNIVPPQTGNMLYPIPNIPEKKRISSPIQPQLISHQTPNSRSVQHHIPQFIPVSNVAPPTKSRPGASPNFQDKTWFHGPIPRDEAARRIASMGKEDGIFLVRESTTYRGSYVLTMLSNNQLRNFQIQNHGDLNNPMYGIDDGPRFISVDEMIQHYSSFDDRLPCKLTHCCIKPDFSTKV